MAAKVKYLYVHRSGSIYTSTREPTSDDYGHEARIRMLGVFVFQGKQFYRLNTIGTPEEVMEMKD